MGSKKQNDYLNLFRFYLCISVLLFHLNILKGGFLSVCSFFVLSGFFSYKHAQSKEKFKILEYYKYRFKRIYFPLLIVVFTTIAIYSFFTNISWYNIKNETFSVLFSYNNLWQLTASKDYFAGDITSPFTHLWYISILVQFDIIFPLLYCSIKKISQAFGEENSILLISIIVVLLSTVFYTTHIKEGIMEAYYNTQTRMFSILYGFLIAMIIDKIKLKSRIISKLMYYLLFAILIFLCIFVSSSSEYMMPSMIVVSFITGMLIIYAYNCKNKENFITTIIEKISKISYEIYLVQYPLIYAFIYINVSPDIKNTLVIIITIIISYIINYALSNKKSLLRKIILLILIIISLFGCYKFALSEDNSKERKALEKQLTKNNALMIEYQKEYEEKIKKDEEDWLNKLNEIELSEEQIKKNLSESSIIGLGDSIMLGAVDELYREFPNGYFDAGVSRTAWTLNNTLTSLNNKNMLGSPIVINMGANGDCSEENKDKIMSIIGDRDVFWLTVTNNEKVHFNEKITEYAKKYDNLHIIDWNTISNGHTEYFAKDGIHLTYEGKKAYVQAIYDSIYNYYLSKNNINKEEVLKEHNENELKKITFFGNDLLLNAYSDLIENYKDAKYVLDTDIDLIELNKELSAPELTYKIVLAFDDNTELTSNDYIDIIEKYKESHMIYIFTKDKEVLNIIKKYNDENIVIVDYSKTITNKDYLKDKTHLNNNGNKKLINLIKDTIN